MAYVFLKYYEFFEFSQRRENCRRRFFSPRKGCFDDVASHTRQTLAKHHRNITIPPNERRRIDLQHATMFVLFPAKGRELHAFKVGLFLRKYARERPI